ncbi:cytochrome-c peroxidase [Pseudoalteromonas phenolica]|uniref:Cytochrome-c peroxidase n=1 Tax=Pseudoalteromonas phenolica TaxID=161398 RepID=A0A0S2K2H9_9GAMM|nr:cytochrome c peroxidase [Pseudoalteromonas phenolica]ALO42698.1 Cytochrome-c peroxidase [Pseudoalteromonas phenolica]MBE0356195.1 cytochrome c peroxidase [Pseudoalteromonas phenolica O-BC30]RXF06365.1 cytochrome-c peroxidase [Pseudoalteromonas phenolica O-BC30]
MMKLILTLLLSLSLMALNAQAEQVVEDSNRLETLTQLYQQHPSKWPAIETMDGRKVSDLAPLTNLKAEPSKQQVELGKRLFNDPILSRDKTVSCASCHMEDKVFADGRPQGQGIDNLVGNRNTPAIIGVDHWRSFFWDGRADSALAQALMPIENPIEMDLKVTDALKRLNNDKQYVESFKRVFETSTIEAKHLAQALVAFERTIDKPDTLFQRFIHKAYSAPKQALSMLNERQLSGMHLFRTKAKCMTCHEGPLLSDNLFHVTGFHNYGRPFQDLGRYEHTKDIADVGKFRTPTLLAISKTAPWMHNGFFTEFRPMIDQYNRGGFKPKPRGRFIGDKMFPTTTDLIQPTYMSAQEVDDLVEFLKIL